MTFESSIAFVLAMSVFVASPGPGMMACIAEGMKRGVSGSAPFVLGMIIGDIVYLSFAIFGLAAFAHILGKAFFIIRIAGGIYLIYLGVKIFISSGEPAKVRGGGFLTGLFITLSNPKVIIFYCGFLPNFMNLSKLTIFDAGIVVILVSLVISVVMFSYAFFAYKTGRAMSGRSTRLFNRSTGTILVSTGTYIVAKS